VAALHDDDGNTELDVIAQIDTPDLIPQRQHTEVVRLLPQLQVCCGVCRTEPRHCIVLPFAARLEVTTVMRQPATLSREVFEIALWMRVIRKGRDAFQVPDGFLVLLCACVRECGLVPERLAACEVDELAHANIRMQ
jgi:hypothetical protein